MRLININRTGEPRRSASVFRKFPADPASIRESQRVRNWTVVIPFLLLASGRASAWVGTVRVRTADEASGLAQEMLADSRWLAGLLIGDAAAGGHLRGPDALAEAGLQVGTPIVLDAAEVARNRVKPYWR